MKPHLLLISLISPIISFGQLDFVIKPYLQFGQTDGMSILWETNEASSTTVLYGEALIGANAANLEQSISLNGNRNLHEVELTNLKPATKYLYQTVSTSLDGTIIKSDISTFKTNINDDDAYFFALVGDSQYSSRSPEAWGHIAQRVWQDRPNFVIHAGDLVDVGTRKTDWTNHFFPNGEVIMSRYPMYTVLGNHEQDADYYYDYMANPAPEYYYTFHYGNAQFFMIDTNRDVAEGSEQYDWLEWQLAKSKAKWKFVVHHHPPYSSEENDHGDTYIGASSYGTHARNLVPLYERYEVDFCLFGHTHVYERSWPLKEGMINKQNGVVYINSGGAGGGLEDFDPVRSWFTKELQQGHHYCTFAIHGDELVFKAIDIEGRMFDTFQMDKKDDTESNVVIPPVPQFDIDKTIFQNESQVKLKSFSPDLELYYTTDGSAPTMTSQKYRGPVNINKSCTIRAVAINDIGNMSRIVSRKLTQMQPQKAINPGSTIRGLKYTYYEGKWDFLPDFNKLVSIESGVSLAGNLEGIPHRENHFGVVLTGYLEVNSTDTYTIYTYSDDGSKLYINDELLIDSDGKHSAKYVYGTTILEKGKHKIRIEYFEGGGNNFMYSGFVREGNDRKPFSPFQLSH